MSSISSDEELVARLRQRLRTRRVPLAGGDGPPTVNAIIGAIRGYYERYGRYPEYVSLCGESYRRVAEDADLAYVMRQVGKNFPIRIMGVPLEHRMPEDLPWVDWVEGSDA